MRARLNRAVRLIQEVIAELDAKPGLELSPLTQGLRVRFGSATTYDIIEVTSLNDILVSLESDEVTMQRLGVRGRWIKVRTSAGNEGYSAAWLLQLRSQQGGGVNIDPLHPLGNPDPEDLGDIRQVRFNYNISQGRGLSDLSVARRFYEPIIDRYRAAGKKITLIFTHQTWGEGQGFNWSEMGEEEWADYTKKFALICQEIVGQYRDKIEHYQIWNEQDTLPAHARAAVPLTMREYSWMFFECEQQIRRVYPEASIITGGFVSGNITRIRDFITHMRPLRLDSISAIAIHPYGKGAAPGPYMTTGGINLMLNEIKRIWKGPIIITEWGVLDQQNDPSQTTAIAQYSRDFLNATRGVQSFWYAYADSMDNGFGLVDNQGNPKEPLYGVFV